MKKTSLLMILVLVGILVLGAGAVFAADEHANSVVACEHASETGKLNANPINSVLGSCGGPPG